MDLTHATTHLTSVIGRPGFSWVEMEKATIQSGHKTSWRENELYEQDKDEG